MTPVCENCGNEKRWVQITRRWVCWDCDGEVEMSHMDAAYEAEYDADVLYPDDIDPTFYDDDFQLPDEFYG